MKVSVEIKAIADAQAAVEAVSRAEGIAADNKISKQNANASADDARMRRQEHEEKRDEEDEIRMNLENDLAGVNAVIL